MAGLFFDKHADVNEIRNFYGIDIIHLCNIKK